MAPRPQNVPAAKDGARYCARPKRYVFSRPLNAPRDKLLSRRVDGKLKLFQIDGLWNAELRCPVDVLTLGN